MAPSNPPRKFAPMPVEESTKSSRQRPTPAGGEQKPRRFAPEPVEETVRSSKDTTQPPSEPEKTKPRRFAPDPVEQTTKSSKPRRFAPQLVEESENSSKDKSENEKKQHIKFKPEPIATTYGSKRKVKRQQEQTSSTPADAEPEKKPPRKFAPILLDTARRSRRAGDPNAPISQDYRTEYGYHVHAREHWRRLQGEKTPTPGSEAGEEEGEYDDDQVSPTAGNTSQLRPVAPLDGSAPSRSRCLVPQRTHSFRMPELDTIQSSESEDGSNTFSTPPTPKQESSPITVSDSFEMFKHATKRRESIDEDWQHYLLDLERKKAQQRLEEQALAAYPNVDFGYEHPHHYFNEDDDSEEVEIEERPVTWEGNEDDLMEMDRRESAINLSFEQRELQRHAENMQQERNANKTTAKQQVQSPFMKTEMTTEMPDAVDAELKSMRDRARPPMLGYDIVFPRCASPDPARFDVTQSSATLRNQMNHLEAAAEHERQKSGEEGGLWQAQKSANTSAAKSPVSVIQQSPVNAKPPSSKGLWGGFCHEEGDGNKPRGGLATPPKATGLMTPKQEGPNPFQIALTEGRPIGLMTPETLPARKLRHRTDLEQLNAKLVTEGEIDEMMEREYPDSFITQVYNYLSLGYPSLARAFDDELSKISRVPISELRQDDEKAKATPRGYIRLGPDFEGGGGEGMTEESCMRWRALKRYVREWARQEKNMVKTDGIWGNWGAGARRGSWAI